VPARASPRHGPRSLGDRRRRPILVGRSHHPKDPVMTDRSRRDVILAATALAVGVTATGTRAAASTPASKASFPPVVHHVFFWLKNADFKENLSKLLAGLRSLEDIVNVRCIHFGVSAESE